MNFKLLILIFLFNNQLNAQGLSNNKIPSDSIIMNSVPYRMWFYEYVKLRKDTNFKKILNRNLDLKNLYDSADKYYNLIPRHNYYAATELLVGQAGIFIFSNNLVSTFILHFISNFIFTTFIFNFLCFIFCLIYNN